MRKADVVIGRTYVVRVSGRLVPVTLLFASIHGGWQGRNEYTDRRVRIKSARRLRFQVVQVERRWRRARVL